jgi:hypothetical protein
MMIEVIVRMDAGTLRVSRESNTEDLDVQMMMLGTALRHLDLQQRILTGINAQQQVKAQQEQMDLARRLVDPR